MGTGVRMTLFAVVLMALLLAWLASARLHDDGHFSEGPLADGKSLSRPALPSGVAVPEQEPAREQEPVVAQKPAAQQSVRISDPAAEERATQMRLQMVERQLRSRDITNRRVLGVMGRVPRHRFVPEALRHQAYADHPLPIGHRQTISQPYIVALMTQLAQPKANSRALDVGTGSGYQAAVLAKLVKTVYSIEIVRPLADEAGSRLKSLGYDNVEVRCGDGYRGWPEHAPFDVMIVAAAPDHVPGPLVEQLAPGGRLVIPVGSAGKYFRSQSLLVIEKQADGSIRKQNVASVAFVPMTGEAETRDK